jgi:FtsH-binding integral membrane protein
MLFGIYLIIDTQLIIGGKRLELSLDDYVIGALILYMDIIQIFLYLLQMMGRR